MYFTRLYLKLLNLIQQIKFYMTDEIDEYSTSSNIDAVL